MFYSYCNHYQCFAWCLGDSCASFCSPFNFDRNRPILITISIAIVRCLPTTVYVAAASLPRWLSEKSLLSEHYYARPHRIHSGKRQETVLGLCDAFLSVPFVSRQPSGWRAGLRRRRAWVQVAVATLSGNSLRQTVHTHRASVHQAAKLVAVLLRVARVTAGLAKSNGSLPPGL